MSASRLSEISGRGRTAIVSLTSLLPAASFVKNEMTIYTLLNISITMTIAFLLFDKDNGLFAILTNWGNLQHPIFIYAVGKLNISFYLDICYYKDDVCTLVSIIKYQLLIITFSFLSIVE